MSAHASDRVRGGRSFLVRAVVCFLVTAAITISGLLWAVLATPVAARGIVAVGGAVVGAVVFVAVTVAACLAESARRSRDQAWAAAQQLTRLSGEVQYLVDVALPTVGKQVQEGASVDAVLADINAPSNNTLRHLVGAVAYALAAAEDKSARANEACAAIEEGVAWLVKETLPTLMRRVRSGEPLGAVLADVRDPASNALRRLVEMVADELGAAERRGSAAMAACANTGARVQAQVTSMLAELRTLQHKYGDHEVFAALLELDHRVSQLGRLADNVVVLSGGRSGRRWTKPIGMESIVRGAAGRVAAYERVKWHLTSTAAVVGYAAEGAMHALAELIDNATTFSNERTTVKVYVEEEDAGVLITVEDGGLGMRPRERDRAQRLVAEPPQLTMLPGTRLGLAVVGRLAAKHGFAVNFRPSSRGGTGALLMIPRQLITQPKQGPAPGARSLDWPASGSTAEGSQEGGHSKEGSEPDGLPRRRRGATLTTTSSDVSRSEGSASSGDASARLAAFHRSSGGGSSGAALPDQSSR
jgi:signal transduction histidine kinase